ncbi:MAG: hypothetical protein EA374_06260 [Acholeplasmatales bacterium]|nr:MAG: hypothetical protein EA374_06260 [Acholeplasmatales bacterium]
MIRRSTILLVWWLAGCLFFACSSPPDYLSEAEIRAYFEGVSCASENLLISHQPSAELEHLEGIFRPTQDTIHIHKSFTAPPGISPYDYQLMVTKQGIYDTRDMAFLPHQTPIEDETALFEEAEKHLAFFEAAFLNCELLLKRMLHMEDVQVQRQAGQVQLEGRDPDIHLEEVETILRVVIAGGYVQEIHSIIRYQKPATKKENYVIASTRVYNRIIEPPVFPPFEDFFVAE